MPWRLVKVEKSETPTKKYKAIFVDENGKEKSTQFGAKGMDDFTLTNDEEQKERYKQRHKKDLETGDPTKAGYLAMFLLWNKKTLSASIRDYKQRFGM